MNTHVHVHTNYSGTLSQYPWQLTALFDVEGQPEQECVADQLVEEQS